ncbi:MAG: hypothetical protein ACFFG0_44770 [Candidatus Thorarchaeota archaeon]
MSNALYDQILTSRSFNPTYDTMSIQEQMILKEGVRELLRIGINGEGSAPDGFISEVDIRQVFAGITFTVGSKNIFNAPILTDSTTPDLWDSYFSNNNPALWRDRLSKFNDKIKVFRDTLESAGSKKQAYLAMLNQYYGTYAMTRFYDKAEEFANRLWIASISGGDYQQRYPFSSLGDYWQIYLTKLIFEL